MKHGAFWWLLVCSVLLLPACGDDRVRDANKAPVLGATGPQAIQETQLLSLTVAAEDPGDIAALSASGLPTGSTFDPATGQFRWTPSLGSAGTYEVTFRAFDGVMEDTETVTILVKELPAGEPASIAGLTSFPQTIQAEDGDWGVFPGQSNLWDIGENFSLGDGGDDQFDGALGLSVNGMSFPWDQTYRELVFRSPGISAADGFIPVAVGGSGSYSTVLSGSFTALLNASADARLQQTVDLSRASGPLTLSWRGMTRVGGFFSGIFPEDPANRAYFRIKILKADGTLLSTLYETTDERYEYQNITLPPEATGQVVLSVEWRSDGRRFGASAIDDLSLRDGNWTEFLSNGGFESGDLRGWTVRHHDVQNMTSGARSLAGLSVTRSFYTKPNQLWGRWVDVFENPTGSEITARIAYSTRLGSGGAGVIYYTPGTNNRALTVWDGIGSRRNVGIVLGAADRVSFTSATALQQWDGSSSIDSEYTARVPAGGRIAVVNFILMSGRNTGFTATGVTATADEIDAAAQGIVNAFWTDPAYRVGMTADQVESVVNF